METHGRKMNQNLRYDVELIRQRRGVTDKSAVAKSVISTITYPCVRRIQYGYVPITWQQMKYGIGWIG